MTDIEVADAEAELCRLPDVRAARLVTAGHGEVLEVHVLALPGSSVDEVTQQAQVALVTLGIRVDRQAISVVQLEQTVPVTSRDTTPARAPEEQVDDATPAAGTEAPPADDDRPSPTTGDATTNGNGNGKGPHGPDSANRSPDGALDVPPVDHPETTDEDDAAPTTATAPAAPANGQAADAATEADDLHGDERTGGPAVEVADRHEREHDRDGADGHDASGDEDDHPQHQPDVAVAPGQTGSRVAIESVLAQRHGLRCTAAVTLRRGDVERSGSVEGSAASSATLRLVAEATVSALGQIEPRGRNLAVETTTVARIGERWIAVVTLVLLSSTDEEVLAGSAPVRSLGEHEAVVRAVLDASNRRLRLSG